MPPIWRTSWCQMCIRDRDNVVRLIKDVRFFLNTLNRAVGVMVDAGIGATVDRQENEDGITLTINIPHAKS